MDAATDAELVGRIIGGERAAFGELYDRYADRIHDLCLHLLRHPHDAADATADVFLAAAEHLDQLREPEKLRSWLYAIARNEVYRRTRQRRREQVMDAGFDELVDLTDSAPAPDPTAMAGLLREASLGLDDRDRLVMELTLAGGIDGKELGDALGLDVAAAHQAAHRMRERLGRSVGALLVARQGRDDCAELGRLLSGWDGSFSVLWRKRVARHVDGCDTCERRRRLVPAAVLDGVALAAPLPIRFVGPPPEVRTRVMAGIGTGTTAAAWDGDGFPPRPSSGSSGRGARWLAAAVVLAVLVAVGVAAGRDDAVPVRVESATERRDTTTVPPDRLPTTTAADGSTSSGAAPSSSTPPTSTPVAPPATTVPTPVAVPTTPPGTPPTAPPRRPTTTSPTPTTTAAPTTTTVPPPTVSVAVPDGLHANSFCPPNPDVVATASASVTAVSMTWRIVNANGGTTSGSLAMADVGTTWRASWQPVSTGRFTVTVTATDAQQRTATATATGVVGVCIP